MKRILGNSKTLSNWFPDWNGTERISKAKEYGPKNKGWGWEMGAVTAAPCCNLIQPFKHHIELVNTLIYTLPITIKKKKNLLISMVFAWEMCALCGLYLVIDSFILYTVKERWLVSYKQVSICGNRDYTLANWLHTCRNGRVLSICNFGI